MGVRTRRSPRRCWRAEEVRGLQASRRRGLRRPRGAGLRRQPGSRHPPARDFGLPELDRAHRIRRQPPRHARSGGRLAGRSPCCGAAATRSPRTSSTSPPTSCATAWCSPTRRSPRVWWSTSWSLDFCRRCPHPGSRRRWRAATPPEDAGSPARATANRPATRPRPAPTAPARSAARARSPRRPRSLHPGNGS